MSTVTNVLQTGNQLISNFDLSKFLLGFNSFAQPIPSVAASGADVVLLQGMVLGRISGTGLIVPADSASVDGSQFPIGCAIIDQTILDGDTDPVNIVNKGRVAESKINFDQSVTADDLDAVVDGRTYRDWLNDIGLELMAGEELTGIDNQ